MEGQHVGIIDCGSAKVAAIGEIIAELGGSAQIMPLAEANGFGLNRFDVLIVSGGPHLFTDPDRGEALIARFAFIDHLDIPLLGICLGHQAIGIRRGVQAFRGSERREWDPVRIVADHPLVRDLAPETVFREDHCEGIALPPGFVGIGTSRHYPNEIMAARDRPVFGVQFHPEVSGDPGKVLLHNFLQIAGGS